MKKTAVILVLVFIIFSCSRTPVNKRKPIAVQKDGTETYLFKVDGIQDSLIADSIWKMVFTFQNDIEKMLISLPDSSVVITINPKNMDAEKLAAEIENRGGKVLN